MAILNFCDEAKIREIRKNLAMQKKFPVYSTTVTIINTKQDDYHTLAANTYTRVMKQTKGYMTYLA